MALGWQMPVAASAVPAGAYDAIVDNSAGVVRDTSIGLYVSIGDALNTLKNTFGKTDVTIGVRLGTGTYTETTAITGTLTSARIVGLSGGNIGSGGTSMPLWDLNAKAMAITNLHLFNLNLTATAANANTDLFTANYVSAYNCRFVRTAQASRITKNGSDHTLVDCMLTGTGAGVSGMDPGCINLEMLGGCMNINLANYSALGNSVSGMTQWNYHGVHWILRNGTATLSGPAAVALLDCSFGDGFGVADSSGGTITVGGATRFTLHGSPFRAANLSLNLTDLNSCEIIGNFNGIMTITNANLAPYTFVGSTVQADITGPGVYDIDAGQVSVNDVAGVFKLRGVGIALRMHANGIGNTATGLLVGAIGLTRSRIDLAVRFTGTPNNQSAFAENATCGSNIVDVAGDGSFPLPSAFNGAPPAGTVASLFRLA
jgi:hypothetical protein